MQLEIKRLVSALFLEGCRTTLMTQAMQQVIAVLEDFAIPIIGQSDGATGHVVIQLDDRLVHLVLCTNQTARFQANRTLHLGVEDRTHEVTGAASHVLLAEMTMRLHARLHPSHVMWLNEATILTSAEFIEITKEDTTGGSEDFVPTGRKENIFLHVEDIEDAIPALPAQEIHPAFTVGRRVIRCQGKTAKTAALTDMRDALNWMVEDLSEPAEKCRMSA